MGGQTARHGRVGLAALVAIAFLAVLLPTAHLVGDVDAAWATEGEAAVPSADAPIVEGFPVGHSPLASINVGMADPRALAVDPANGRVYVTGEDELAVFEADGTLVTRVPGLVDPGEPVVADGDLWVRTVVDPDDLHLLTRIDTDTLTVADTVPVTRRLNGEIAIVDGKAWTLSRDGSLQTFVLVSIDLDDGTVVEHIRGLRGYAIVVPVPGRPDRLMVHDTSVIDVDISGAIATVVSEKQHGPFDVVRQVAFGADGTTYAAAALRPDRVRRYAYPALTYLDQLGMAWVHEVMGIASNPAGGGIYAISLEPDRVMAWQAGATTPFAIGETTTDPIERGIALSPDGTTAYALMDRFQRLEIFSLAPDVTSVSPPEAVAEQVTEVVIEGSSLGNATVTLHGQPLDVVSSDVLSLTVTIPSDQPAGSGDLVVHGAVGTMAVPFELHENVGRAIGGTVAGPDGPAAGIELTIDGDVLAAPRTTTSGADGSWTIAGIDPVERPTLTVTDPMGDLASQRITGFALTANTTFPLDVQLSPDQPPRGEGAIAVRTPVSEWVRSMTVDPATGEIYASAGDELVIIDPAGRITGRVLGIPDASQSLRWGDDLFVTTYGYGPIVRIDHGTLQPRPPVGTGSLWIVAAGGYLWSRSDGRTTPTTIERIDPSTGETVSLSVPGGAGAATAVGADGLLTGGALFDVSTGSLVPTVGPPGAFASVATDDGRGLNGNGTELDLSTLEWTGATYPGNDDGRSGHAWHPAHGGTQLLGPFVTRPGVFTPIVEIDLDGGHQSAAVSLDGERAVLAADDVVVQWDLAPRIDAVEGGPVAEGAPTAIVLRGQNLGWAESIELGGRPVVPITQTPTEVTFEAPVDLAPGAHLLTLDTGLGTTTTPLVVTPSDGATLTGVVTHEGEPVAGARIELTGGSLTSPRVTVADDTGTYALDAVPLGDDHRLEVTDPSGRFAPWALERLALVPGSTSVVDVEMSPRADRWRWAPYRSHQLASDGRSLLVEPTTGRIFVAFGDEVLVLAPDGAPLTRIRGLWGAHGLTAAGGLVHVLLPRAAEIAVIDAEQLAVVDRLPTRRTTLSRGLAEAGGTLWFITGDHRDPVLCGLDAESGDVRCPDGPGEVDALGEVTGRPDELILVNYSGDVALRIVDASDHELALLRSSTLDEGALYEASNPLGLLWSTKGTELDLDSLVPTGNVYDTSSGSSIAVTDHHGGLIARGSELYRVGETHRSATVTAPSSHGGSGFTSDGASFAVVSGTSVSVSSLGPHASPMAARWIRPGEAKTVQISGRSMAWVTDVSVAGTPVSFSRVSDHLLDVHVPAALTDVDTVPAWLPVTITSDLGIADDTAVLSIGYQPPDAPRGPWCDDAVGQDLTVRWDEPDEPGSSPITSYVVDVDGRSVTVDGAERQVTLVGLGNALHHPEVRAVSADGTSPPAIRNYGCLVPWPFELTSEPTALTADAGPGVVTFAWADPTQLGSAPLTGYEVRRADGSTTIVPADQTSIVLHDLEPGTPVSVEVRAVTTAWPSSWAVTPEATPSGPVDVFTDVTTGHPLYWEIWAAAASGQVTGYADGTFRPSQVVSRQVAVAMLWRAAGEPAGPFPDPAFGDVAPTNPFAVPIAWAVEEGITTGRGDGTFGPTDPVTRQVWMAFQHRAAGAPAGPFPDPGFTDVAPTSPFATPIWWAVGEGITTGRGDGTFGAADPVTRAAVAAFLARSTWPSWTPA